MLHGHHLPFKGAAWPLPFTKASDYKRRDIDDEKDWIMRIPFGQYLNDTVRNHFVACSGEFVGTVLFLFLALGGTQVANNIPTSSGQTVAEVGSNPQQLQYIALCFGFSLAVNAWVFFRISGGLFNPAVTVGMCLIGALPWVRGTLLFFTQIVGGIVAAAIVYGILPGPLSVQTTLGGGTSTVQGLFLEMILTGQLVFTIIMLAAEKHKSTFIAPVGIGLSLFIAELLGVYFTGGSLNPARSFGPAVVTSDFPHYHWIYWVGPMLGSFLAAAFYKFIKALEYETANPGQDGADIIDRPVTRDAQATSSDEEYLEQEKSHVQEANKNADGIGGVAPPDQRKNDISMGGGQQSGGKVQKAAVGMGGGVAGVEGTKSKTGMGQGYEGAPQAQKSDPTMGQGSQNSRPYNRGASYMA
ncbi:related to aquaporin [Ramularia collo-cygni]|uniref:Related to aquaporin n=1 Tax=Ramularia collo-cygni TaxID=112498 RepID=A0A2D3VLP4_9PEZI|nr:related to aquaporin [Ramularia collo-cygni]CZT23504.1 related to aquaporin [Ramularia collo-cygni]